MKIFGKELKFNNYKVYHAGDKPTASEIGAATSSHTHNYAGSSSAGGAATSALTCTGNATTATKLQTARTLKIGNTGKTFDGSANVSWTLDEIGAASENHMHAYVPVSEYLLTMYSNTLTIGTSWIDTGISGSVLASGSYIVQVSGMSSSATSFYSEIWTGVMSWYEGSTNSTDVDEIVLHKAGHASNGKTIYLRTVRTSSSGSLKLQISASAALSSTNVTFKFRKLI